MKNYLKEKIFCIGLGKTGTTTLEKTLFDLGYSLGIQRKGELLVEDWAKRNFNKIIQLAHTADAFQDIPFCLPYTFQILDVHFPNAKFILTIRENSEEWYSSVIRFHGKLFGENKRIPPTIEDLKQASYLSKGRPYTNNRFLYTTPENDPYNKSYFLEYYNRHFHNVSDYFRHRSDKLIIVNVSKQEDYRKLCNFLGKVPVSDNFPWLNKT